MTNMSKKLFDNKTLKWSEDGFWYMSPMPTNEALSVYYSQLYWVGNSGSMEILVNRRDYHHYTFISEVTRERELSIQNFLNFGAGHGGMSFLMHACGRNIWNIEPGPLCNFGLERFHVLKSFDELENKFSDVRFDLIYSSHALEHMPSPFEFLKSAYRYLDENGLLIIEVPNTRVSNPSRNYTHGGCNGKTDGSHTLYFTKDFFDNFGAEVYFYSGDYNAGTYKLEKSEDSAKYIRAIIKKGSLAKVAKLVDHA
jgi:2-polyprenyl-3-methyl-5-hydroxy-6-metoxy-1,4-benzoquinol methylase